MLYDLDMEKKSIGKRISLARITSPERRVTQAQLAEHLGVTPQAVSGWERDEAYPEIDKIAKIADFLGVPIGTLLAGDDPQARDLLMPIL